MLCDEEPFKTCSVFCHRDLIFNQKHVHWTLVIRIHPNHKSIANAPLPCLDCSNVVEEAMKLKPTTKTVNPKTSFTSRCVYGLQSNCGNVARKTRKSPIMSFGNDGHSAKVTAMESMAPRFAYTYALGIGA